SLQIVEPCNTNTETCQQLYYDAILKDTKEEQCELYEQVFTCLDDNITAACKEHEQVKPSITQLHEGSESICNPSSLTSNATDQYCSAYQQMITCFEANITATCKEDEQVKTLIEQTQQTVDSLCDPSTSCQMALYACQAPLTAGNSTESSRSHCEDKETDSFQDYCRLPARCSLSTEFAPTVESYHHMFPLYRYLYCDPNGDENDHTPSSTTTQPLHSDDVTSAGGPPESSYESSVQTAQTFSIPSPPIPKLDIEQFCTASAMFDCLTDVSSTCSIDQGNVTFAQVKQAAADMCQSFFPYWQTLAACGSLMECVANANNLTLLESVTNTSHQPSNEDEMGVVRLLVGATRTGFWCSFMDHVYGCAMDSATRCSLQDHLMMMVRGKRAALADTCQGAATAAPPSQDTNGEPLTTRSPGGNEGGNVTGAAPPSQDTNGEPLTTRSPGGNEGGNVTGAAPPSQDTNGEPLTTRSPGGNEGGNVTGGQNLKMELSGKSVFLTGGARGIGRAMMQALLEKGAKVLFCDILDDKGKATEADLQKQYGADVMFQTVRRDRCTATTSQLALEHMRRDRGGRGGIIVNTASIAGDTRNACLEPQYLVPDYSATKHAIIGFTTSCAKNPRMSEMGVKWRALCPGVVDTDLIRTPDDPAVDKAGFKKLKEQVTKQGIMQPSELAQAFISMLEDQSSDDVIYQVVAGKGSYRKRQIVDPDGKSNLMTVD
ncbi:hypothetical protein BaRGS_00034660, partial [Batillaria attramentaria]